MYYLILSFMTSTIGAICGLGGGIILKPALDAMGNLSVTTVSFLSGVTVLSMSIISVIRSRGNSNSLHLKTITPLGIGAAIGGLLGKNLFDMVKVFFGNENYVGATQSIALLTMTFICLIYTLTADKIKTMNLRSYVAGIGLGILLGIISAFLGIGGGPVNLLVLCIFFSMDTKTAVVHSIYIIMLSQFASLVNTLITGMVPDFGVSMIIFLIIGGVLGGTVGRSISNRLSNKAVTIFYRVLLVCIMLINVYNAIHFLNK